MDVRGETPKLEIRLKSMQECRNAGMQEFRSYRG